MTAQNLIESLISADVAYEEATRQRAQTIVNLQAQAQVIADRLTRLLPEGMYFVFDDVGFRERER